MKAEYFSQFRSADEIAEDERREAAIERGEVCPMCGSHRIKFEDIDISDAQTGYFDIVTNYQCEDCHSSGKWEE